MMQSPDPSVRVVDVDGFNARVAEQVQILQSVIAAEHANQIAILRAQIDELQLGTLPEADTAKLCEVTLEEKSAEERRLHYDITFQMDQDRQLDNTNGREDNDMETQEQGGHQTPLRQVSGSSQTSPPRDRTHILYQAPTGTRKSLHRTSTLKDPLHVPHENRNCVQALVLSHAFELTSGVLIMLNTVIIALQQQYSGFDYGYDIKMPEVTQVTKSAKETWPGGETAFFICNVTFNTMFLIELLLRLAAHGWRSVKSGWMWFDTVVVTVGIIDMCAADALAFNPGMMRVMRLFRLVRLLQVFETMSSFDSLFLLLKALHASREALIWSFLILGLVQIMVGLFLCQILQDYLADESNDRDKRASVFYYYGTFSRTVFTMFEILMANWVPACRALTENVSEFFMLFFLVYRCMFCFAVLKVIAAVFITETNRVLESDDELTIMKYNRERAAFRSKLQKTVRKLDKEGSGYLHWEHLEEIVKDEKLVSLLATLGFQMHDLQKLFWLLDDGSGKIPFSDFIGKMGKLKGQSKQIDMLSLLKLSHRIDRKIEALLPNTSRTGSLQEAQEDAACEL